MILSELPPLEMAVPLSPTREGRVWDIQLVTMAIVLSTAPIFSMGTLMSASCGALQPAQPCPLLNLDSRQPGHWTSLSDLFHSLSSCPASQNWWSTVTGVQQHWFGHGDAASLVLGEQLTSSSITLESSLSEWLPQLHPSLPSLSLTLLLSLWLSLSFSLLLSFFGCRAVHWLCRSHVSSESALAARP